MATDEFERNAATLLWQIENLNYYDPKIHNNEICSPLMAIHTLEIEHCSLFLKLDKKDTCLTLYIEKELDFSIHCEFSLLDPNESILISQKIRNTKVSGPTRIKMSNFPTHKELFQTKKSQFLPHDNLRVRCRIWKSSGNVPVSEIISTSSRIKISEDCFLWAIEELKFMGQMMKKAYVAFTSASQDVEDFDILTFRKGDSLQSFSFIFVVRSNFIPERLLMNLKVTMLGDKQEAILLFDDKHVFRESNESQCWAIPRYSLKKESEKEMAKFRYDENLNLLFHFTVVHQQLQEFERTYIETLKLEYDNIRTISSPTFADASCQTSQQNTDTTHSTRITSSPKFTEASCQTLQQGGDTTHSLPCVSDSVNILIDDFRTLYCEQTFSDFELCTRDVSLQVHKNILSARSPVFKAMFSNNMKKSYSQSLDIPDIDSHTLNQLLTFLYTGSIEANLHVKSVAKLYYAADKYQVNSLKHQCFSTLKSGISISNISDILVVAYKHQDEELMIFVEDFILNHFAEVVCSKEWGKFLVVDPFLAETTIQKVCTQIMHLDNIESTLNEELRSCDLLS